MQLSPILHRSLVPYAAVLALASGCVYGEMRQVLRAQVAAEIDCPELAIRPQHSPFSADYKEGQYRVEGCGMHRVYNCPVDTGLVSYGTSHCTYEESKAAPAVRTVVDPMDQDMGPSLMDEPESREDAQSEDAPSEDAPSEDAPSEEPEAE